MQKKNIAIVMGGYSSEYKISLKSGNVVYNTLKNGNFEVHRIYILQEKWVYVDDNNIEYPINKHDFSVDIGTQTIRFDAVFNAIHGHPGEDGILMSYFELLGIPHTSSDSYQLAVTFNKRDCLAILKPYGIRTASSYYLNLGDPINSKDIVDTVGLPCFVKANKAGSSFGITKVYKETDLEKAIEISFKEDDEILIESFLDGKEVSVGVISYKGKTKLVGITEIITDNDFFDYEAKYQGKSKEITPAQLSQEEEEKVKSTALKVYKILKMKGFTRTEYIFVNGEPHLLDINTVPGLTGESLLPQQAKHAGISLRELFEDAIKTALGTYSKLEV
ncbi:MAG: D-alanine--D-alanine ligase [Flavobacteriaceae bacterium]|nr:D-alanine--D-alanine ligase [Flavobacteriaceae bacterium]